MNIGRSPPRREDANLITGAGGFVGDLKPNAVTYAQFARSSMAHARILRMDTSVARSARKRSCTALATTDACARCGTLCWRALRHRRCGNAAVGAAEQIIVDFEELPVVVSIPASPESDSRRCPAQEAYLL